LKFDHKVLKTSLVFHWKLACTPLLDEAIHQSGVKVGVGTLNLCKIHEFLKRHGKTKKIDACWAFTIVVHTFVTIDWLVALNGSCVIFT
jgi:hypothetical protein